MYPERRGNIFAEEVYRLTKAYDAATKYNQTSDPNTSDLPQNSRFSQNDVIMLTMQPMGSGDFFGASTLPTREESVSIEARVISTGPSYIDIALAGGLFESTFGPAPNNMVGPKGDKKLRLRADRFISNVPYTRMIASLGEMTSIPEKNNANITKASGLGKSSASAKLDPLFRELVILTYGFEDRSSPLYQNEDFCNLHDLSLRISKPPLPNSRALTNQVLAFMQSDPQRIFPRFNGPQLTSIGAALTRRFTLIQGPPGTGKTTVAGAICFGFVHQCRNLSLNSKVLACAFSNVGADNLADQMMKVGLKVVRVGRASSVSEHLWAYTLDAAIDRDPDAQKALENAVKATSNLTSRSSNGKGVEKRRKDGNGKRILEEHFRGLATAAVKASIKASNIAAARALREADVIVSTSIGAADPRLLAACGIVNDGDDNLKDQNKINTAHDKPNGRSPKSKTYATRRDSPDGLPALTLPFVIIDEACQSVEPASLIPITATDSCRSVVMLGDPCQLPPTVISDTSCDGSGSPLSVSLMTRLASILPHPIIVTAQLDNTLCENKYLNAKCTRQASSLIKQNTRGEKNPTVYKKLYSGSLLLSVQYRMHPSIAAFSSAVFYDGLLSTPSFLSRYRPFPDALDALMPLKNAGINVRFIDVGGRNNESREGRLRSEPEPVEVNSSYRNDAEANRIVNMLKKMFSSTTNAASIPETIGIVTPYTAQVVHLKNTMARDEEFTRQANGSKTTIEVKSVDAYQGREMDIIIFSCVRSNREGKVGFLKDWRRMNVAFTRAKSALIVVGDLETLMAGSLHWEAFGQWCANIGCVNNSFK